MPRVPASRWVWVLVAGLVTALVLVVVAIETEGPDRSVRGTVTSVESH